MMKRRREMRREKEMIRKGKDGGFYSRTIRTMLRASQVLEF